MKAFILGLAAMLAFTAASAQAASPFTFTITAESSSGVLPTDLWGYSSFEGGEKFNVNRVLRDNIFTIGNYRYITHMADITYDRLGGYRDTTVLSANGADGTHAPDYVYFKATATATPGADQSAPMTVEVSSDVSGTYSTVKDPRFPNVNTYPASATVAAADSHNAADLTNISYGHTWFNKDGRFFVYHSSNDKTIPAEGSLELGVLFYLPAQLHATSFTFDLTGPLYDTGLHHFSETIYLDTEVQAIPEPTTWAMLLTGIGIVGAARRRKTAA